MNNSNELTHEINSEIRKNRAVDVTVTVLDADQTPFANQEITIQQVRHKFLFGTAAFDVVSLANGEYAGEQKEQAEQRAEKLLALCNYATLPFYWARFEPERGKPRTIPLKNAAQWCLDHHLPVKG